MKHPLPFLPLAIATLLLSLPLVAAAKDDAARQKEYFEQHKAERLKHIKARQDLLSQEYACLQGAASIEAAKSCDEKARAAHQSMEEQKRRTACKRCRSRKPGDVPSSTKR